MPKEKPILFKPEMVRAILDGKKTQTRRIVKERITQEVVGGAFPSLVVWFKDKGILYPNGKGEIVDRCPYGKPGDRLWVREPWCQPYSDEGNGETFYRADGERDVTWKPSIHMPRNICRLVLEIIDIRVERLQDITEDDAMAEGITVHLDAVMAASIASESPARMEFWSLWNSIHSKDGYEWDKSPWVWVLTFKRT